MGKMSKTHENEFRQLSRKCGSKQAIYSLPCGTRLQPSYWQDRIRGIGRFERFDLRRTTSFPTRCRLGCFPTPARRTEIAREIPFTRYRRNGERFP